MYLFLAQTNCLVHLDLSGTDCAVDSVSSVSTLSASCFDHTVKMLNIHCLIYDKDSLTNTHNEVDFVVIEVEVWMR